jgi:hypothetical protein
MDPKQDKAGADDVILIHGFDPRRRELHVVRSRDGDIGLGIVRPVEEGRPIDGDIVRLKPRKDLPLLCDVEHVLSIPDTPTRPAPAGRSHPGPARVSSEEYRRGWEQVFGRCAAPDPEEVN